MHEARGLSLGYRSSTVSFSRTTGVRIVPGGQLVVVTIEGGGTLRLAGDSEVLGLGTGRSQI